MKRRLAGVAAAVTVASATGGGAARAADADPWLGPDKALHFGASAVIAGSATALGTAVFEARGHALLFGGGVAVAFGLGKEALDLAGLGHPSLRDLAWDGLGVVTGMALAWSLDLLIRGVSERHPLLVAPRRDATAGAFAVRF